MNLQSSVEEIAGKAQLLTCAIEATMNRLAHTVVEPEELEPVFDLALNVQLLARNASRATVRRSLRSAR